MTGRRAVATLLFVIYLPNSLACTIKTSRNVPLTEVRTTTQPNTDPIDQLVTKAGQTVRFDRRGARLEADTIRGNVRGKPYVIALADVERVSVLRKNSGLSAVGTIATVAFLAAGVLLIAVAASSCPFVYSWDGEQYVFDAEPHGGAITAGLERTDLSELEHLVATGGEYRLLLHNEMPETQYLNLAQLWVADHPVGTRAVRDESGGLRLVGASSAPIAARDQDGGDLRPTLLARDELVYEPPPASGASSPRDTIVLTFPRPQTERGILIADVATGTWGAQMVYDILALRGSSVSDWYQAIDNDPGSRRLLHEWNAREELYLLNVEVEEAGGWHTRGTLSGGGPYSAETQSLSLDLTRVTGDSVRLRVRPPKGFWAINAFALAAFHSASGLTVDTLSPTVAIDSLRGDIRPALAGFDQRRYEMPRTGDRAYLTFTAPSPRAGRVRTVFLYSGGYYRLNLPEEGNPDVAALTTITNEPDATARLAGTAYLRYLDGARNPGH